MKFFKPSTGGGGGGGITSINGDSTASQTLAQGTGITIVDGGGGLHTISATGGSLPALAQNHLYVGNASNLPVDGGANLTYVPSTGILTQTAVSAQMTAYEANANSTIFTSFENTSAGSFAAMGLRFYNNLGLKAQMLQLSSTNGLGNNKFVWDGVAAPIMITSRTGNVDLGTVDVNDSNAWFRLFNNGHIAVGPNPSDAGYPFDVQVDAHFGGSIADSTGSVGTSGQILSSTVTGTAWITATGGVPASPDTAVQYNQGGTFGADGGFYRDYANNFATQIGSIGGTGTATLFLPSADTAPLSLSYGMSFATGATGTFSIGNNGSNGVVAQLAASSTSGGTTLYVDETTGVSFFDVNSGKTTFFPKTFSNPTDNGKFLQLDSSTGQTSWQTVSSSSVSILTAAYGTTVNYTAGLPSPSTDLSFTTGTGATGVFLPTTITVGDVVTINDLDFIAFTSNITIDAGTGNTITWVDGISQTKLIAVSGTSLTLRAISSTQWMAE